MYMYYICVKQLCLVYVKTYYMYVLHIYTCVKQFRLRGH